MSIILAAIIVHISKWDFCKYIIAFLFH
jgi:hypothetical protein